MGKRGIERPKTYIVRFNEFLLSYLTHVVRGVHLFMATVFIHLEIISFLSTIPSMIFVT